MVYAYPSPAPLPTAQQQCDLAQAKVRCQPVSPLRVPVDRPKPLTISDDVVDQRLSEELAYMRRALDALGDTLCADPIILARYASALQQFDIIGQTLGHLATIVGTSNRAEAIERVGMRELKARLQRRALT